jgi:fatty-acyl-CoA synthase
VAPDSAPHGTVQERRQALDAQYPSWVPRTLSGALDAAAERYPDRAFLLTHDQSYTYADVREWSIRLAGGLVASGVAPGDHVAVLMANHPEFAALKFAIARAGAVAVPINFLLRASELGYILNQSDATLLVTMSRFRNVDQLAKLDELAPGWETSGGGAAFPRLRGVITFSPGPEDSPGSAGSVRPDSTTLAALEDAADEAALTELTRRADAADPLATADVIYTSGTSGAPKGVMLSHDGLLRSAYGSAWTRAFQDGRKILFALPFYHVFAYVEGLLASMFAGGAIIPQTAFDPVATLDAVQRHRADEALFVPTMTIAVLEAARAASYDTSSLHTVMSAAAPAPVRLWQAVRDELGIREVVTAYGMTETSSASTFTEPDGPLELVASTVGAPKRGGVAGDPELDGRLCAYKTIDPLTGKDLPAGSEGELAARGPIVTRGYYNKPAETAAAIDGEGWLRSGDLAWIDPGNRHVVLTGRSKELYKCGGELVAPKEVEDVLSSHPAVGQAYLVGLPDDRMGEVGCAWVVPTGAEPPPDELIGYCRDRLARFKVPAHVIYIRADELPTTATGKVQKFRLIERARRLLETDVGSAERLLE